MTLQADLQFAVLLGSLRKDSFNHSIANTLDELAPEHVQVTLLGSVGDIPHYSADAQTIGFPSHVARMAEAIDVADALIIVTPEYNYGAPPALLNALDYLFKEWAYKPAGFVSYGGLSGGTRSVQMTKQLLTTLKMMPIPEAVNIAFFTKLMDPTGAAFLGSEALEKSAVTMLDELHRWTDALAVLRR